MIHCRHNWTAHVISGHRQHVSGCRLPHLGQRKANGFCLKHPGGQWNHGLHRGLVQAQAATAAAAPTQGASVSATTAGALRVLYPQLTSHSSGYLKVSDIHTLYYEVYGNPSGTPAVVVHGGPGAGCFPNHARFFDPKHYRIILVDQRGCGRSTPYGCLAGNTTADLVADLEQLRKSLGVQQWLMLGGSWGVALALAYAQAYPSAVLGLILRGVCLMRPKEIHWMYGGGAGALQPLGWSKFLEHLPPAERSHPLLGYYKRMLSRDVNTRAAAAKAWLAWEMSVGFSSNNEVFVWDGRQWSTQPAPACMQQQPQQQQALGRVQPWLPPPPKPAGQAAVAAAAGGLAPLLHRGTTGSPWFGLDSEHRSGTAIHSNNGSSTEHGPHDWVSCADSAAAALDRRNDCTTTTSAAAALTSQTGTGSRSYPSTTLGAGASNNCNEAYLPSSRRKGGSVGAMSIGSSPVSTVLPTIQQQQELADAETLDLIQSGLHHTGFRDQAYAQALLEAHYSVHGAFLHQQPLLDHLDRVRHIPCIAVQGQWDLVCPPTTAVELSQAWPEMELRLVPRAGHSMYDAGITHELVNAADRMRSL